MGNLKCREMIRAIKEQIPKILDIIREVRQILLRDRIFWKTTISCMGLNYQKNTTLIVSCWKVVRGNGRSFLEGSRPMSNIRGSLMKMWLRMKIWNQILKFSSFKHWRDVVSMTMRIVQPKSKKSDQTNWCSRWKMARWSISIETVSAWHWTWISRQKTCRNLRVATNQATMDLIDKDQLIMFRVFINICWYFLNYLKSYSEIPIGIVFFQIEGQVGMLSLEIAR